ncbi:hypothetical protein ERJ75_000432000 [Trypanosoma vivax]|nr:hypothetical protein TRVL_04596 [Trypanosoma vivax]KAH8617040.1 hypothetical protein ERJ75_000432000 [Trypanosoma vivax]
MPARGAGEDASRGRGVSILVMDGVGVEVGVLEKKVPERATVTQALGQCESNDRIGAFPQKGRRFQRVAGHLAGNKRVIGSRSGRELTPHAVGPLRQSDDKGECIVDWCV